MVTSPSYHRMLQLRGLVSTWQGLECQFRGDWSQRIASLTSESDSNTFAGDEMQHIYLFSLTTAMNRYSHNPRVPTTREFVFKLKSSVPGVRVHYSLLLAFCQFPFVASQWQLWRKVINGKCGSLFVYKCCQTQLNFKRARVWIL